MSKFVFAVICLIALLFAMTTTVKADHFVEGQQLTVSQSAIQTSISAGSITALANKIIPVVFQKIQTTSIPNVDNGHHHITGIHVPKLQLDALTLSTTSNALKFAITGFSTHVSAHYKYKRGVLKASVGFKAIIEKSNLKFDILLTQNNGRLVIGFANSSFTAGKATFKLTGGLKAKFLNGLKSLFNSKIKKAIVRAVDSGLRSGLQTMTKSMASGIELRAPISTWGFAVSDR
eukprot:UN09160